MNFRPNWRVVSFTTGLFLANQKAVSLSEVVEHSILNDSHLNISLSSVGEVVRLTVKYIFILSY